VQAIPAFISRKTPHEEHVRKRSSAHWFCYVTECPAMREILPVEMANRCREIRRDEFAKTGDTLGVWDFAAMLVAGRVTRVEEIEAR
jgi:hypothetical protein